MNDWRDRDPYTGEPYWNRDWEGGAVTPQLVMSWGLLTVLLGVLVRYWKLYMLDSYSLEL